MWTNRWERAIPHTSLLDRLRLAAPFAEGSANPADFRDALNQA
jgi:hypothetical protein